MSVNGAGEGKPTTPVTKKSRTRRPKLRINATPTERVSQAPCNLRDSGSMHFPDGRVVELHADDLTELSQLGRGTYGYVTLNKHTQSDLKFAVKHIKQQDEPNERKAMLQDLEVNRKTKDCPYTVEFYGALFREGEVLICMEVMDESLYDYYKAAHKCGFGMPQDILGAVSFAVLSAIKFLREELRIMHRDVKPSNILLAEREGKVSIKLCDFGIAGNLINSLAKTNIGCKPYMSPERIETEKDQQGYNVKSDIWSLGISLVELADGKHPYEGANAFKLLQMVVQEPSPCLDQDDRYPECLANFVAKCLKKEHQQRADYNELLSHEFLKLPRDEVSLLKHYKNVSVRIKQAKT